MKISTWDIISIATFLFIFTLQDLIIALLIGMYVKSYIYFGYIFSY